MGLRSKMTSSYLTSALIQTRRVIRFFGRGERCSSPTGQQRCKRRSAVCTKSNCGPRRSWLLLRRGAHPCRAVVRTSIQLCSHDDVRKQDCAQMPLVFINMSLDNVPTSIRTFKDRQTLEPTRDIRTPHLFEINLQRERKRELERDRN